MEKLIDTLNSSFESKKFVDLEIGKNDKTSNFQLIDYSVWKKDICYFFMINYKLFIQIDILNKLKNEVEC